MCFVKGFEKNILINFFAEAITLVSSPIGAFAKHSSGRCTESNYKLTFLYFVSHIIFS